VGASGVDKKNSHSWNVFNQRYAYDLFITDENGKTHRGDGKAIEDYYSFGQAILAPADGLVVKAKDGIRDNPELGSIDIRARIFHGNFVVIRHAQGEYSHLAHFKKGSLTVKEGDEVRQGQVIGLCGNSGHSLEPHLHFHLQDRANFYFALGLPLEFSDFVLKSQGQVQYIARGYISKGQVVKNSK
jgi:murein DD-endopeptidase MepM/ murein hydrolase activator NlpD